MHDIVFVKFLLFVFDIAHVSYNCPCFIIVHFLFIWVIVILKLYERCISLLICEYFRCSDDYVRHAFYLLMTRLEKHHAEIRLSAFQIARELFVRSHCFRDLLLSDFQRFLELVLGKFILLSCLHCSAIVCTKHLASCDGYWLY